MYELAGHSLGGALAELTAHSLMSKLQEQPYAQHLSQHMCCYTFGAPRVGNAAWANEYETLVPSTFHIINDQVYTSNLAFGARIWIQLVICTVPAQQR